MKSYRLFCLNHLNFKYKVRRKVSRTAANASASRYTISVCKHEGLCWPSSSLPPVYCTWGLYKHTKI